MHILIIHGAYGNPEENWFPWLKESLEKEGHKVFVPSFPTPKGQSLEQWKAVMSNGLDKIDENSILIGHSLGPAFILSLLEDIQKQVHACFFVSGFLGKLNNPVFDEINQSFTEKTFNWEKIREHCKQFFLFHSDNDPYVPLEKAEELAHKLNTSVEIVKGAGHFNEKAGYISFPLLLEKIKEL